MTPAQRNLLRGVFLLVLLVGLAGAGYYYSASAPDRAEATFQKGMALVAAGKLPEAITMFDNAISTWDQQAKAYLERGIAKRALKQFDSALADFEQAAALDPTLADAFTARGMIFRDKGDLEKAKAEFTKSLKVRPTLDAYFQRGQIEEAQLNYAQAIADYDLAIDRYRTAPFVYFARSSAKRAWGDEEGAKEDKRTAEELLRKAGR